MGWRQIIILIGVAAICVLGGLAWYANRKTDMPSAVTATAGAPLPETIGKEELHRLGNPNAKVTLIEYAAPRCPHCARFDINVFPQLKQAYIDTGKINFVFRVFPLSEDDGNAEKLARCLPKDQYFSFIDLLFRNQPRWDDEYGVLDVRGGLAQMAQVAGIGAAQAQACMNDKKADADINESTEDAVARYQVNSTPTIIVNGIVRQPPPGQEWSFDAMAKVLDEAAKS